MYYYYYYYILWLTVDCHTRAVAPAQSTFPATVVVYIRAAVLLSLTSIEAGR